MQKIVQTIFAPVQYRGVYETVTREPWTLCSVQPEDHVTLRSTQYSSMGEGRFRKVGMGRFLLGFRTQEEHRPVWAVVLRIPQAPARRVARKVKEAFRAVQAVVDRLATRAALAWIARRHGDYVAVVDPSGSNWPHRYNGGAFGHRLGADPTLRSERRGTLCVYPHHAGAGCAWLAGDYAPTSEYSRLAGVWRLRTPAGQRLLLAPRAKQ